MGIERFFSSLDKYYNIFYSNSHPYKKINANIIYFDFNSIIHITSSKVKNPNNFNIIDATCDYLLNFLENNITSNKITFIMLAIDGVPSKAKMIEQKHRRYMGLLTELMIKKINKNKPDSIWSKNNISPGTTFMDILSKTLKSSDFYQKIKKICPNLKEYIVSDIYEIHEGEKKITDHINNSTFTINDNITIYSPDADMMLLALILKKDSPVTIYRHDQQKSKKEFIYNIIDIELLKKAILHQTKINIKEFDLKPNYKNIINDIVLIFTIFGDDFLPKIESYDVKNDIGLLLDLYMIIFIEQKDYLIRFDEKYKLNYTFMSKLFEIMSRYENHVLKENFLSKKYHNYKKFKNYHLGKEFRDLKKNIKNEINNDSYKYLVNNILFILDKNLFYEYFKNSSDQIIKKYKQYFIYFIDFTELFDYFLDYLRNNIDQKIILIPDKLTDKPIILEEYNKSSTNKYYKNMISGLPKQEVEEYLLLNRLDKYYNKLNSKDLVNLDGSEQSINKYYQSYFNNYDINQIVNQYLTGINWIFQYYYNDEYNYFLWFYKFSHAPLIKNIYDNIQNIDNKNDFNQPINDFKNYFTVLEQFLYISPFTKDLDRTLNILEGLLNKKQIDQIKNFIRSKEMASFYFDLDIIADIIINNNKNNEIDCSNKLFLNKCILKKLEKVQKEELEFVKKFRQYISYNEQQKIFNNLKIK